MISFFKKAYSKRLLTRVPFTFYRHFKNERYYNTQKKKLTNILEDAPAKFTITQYHYFSFAALLAIIGTYYYFTKDRKSLRDRKNIESKRDIRSAPPGTVLAAFRQLHENIDDSVLLISLNLIESWAIANDEGRRFMVKSSPTLLLDLMTILSEQHDENIKASVLRILQTLSYNDENVKEMASESLFKLLIQEINEPFSFNVPEEEDEEEEVKPEKKIKPPESTTNQHACALLSRLLTHDANVKLFMKSVEIKDLENIIEFFKKFEEGTKKKVPEVKLDADDESFSIAKINQTLQELEGKIDKETEITIKMDAPIKKNTQKKNTNKKNTSTSYKVDKFEQFALTVPYYISNIVSRLIEVDENLKESILSSKIIISFLKDEMKKLNPNSRIAASLALSKLNIPYENDDEIVKFVANEKELLARRELIDIYLMTMFVDKPFLYKKFDQLAESSKGTYISHIAKSLAMGAENTPEIYNKREDELRLALKDEHGQYDPEVYFLLAELNFAKGQYYKCLKYMRKGLLLFPRYYPFRDLMFALCNKRSLRPQDVEYARMLDSALTLDCWGVCNIARDKPKE